MMEVICRGVAGIRWRCEDFSSLSFVRAHRCQNFIYRARSRRRRLVILGSILCAALRAEWIMNDVMVALA